MGDTIDIKLSEIVDRYRYRPDLALLFDYKTGVFHRLEGAVGATAFGLASEGRNLQEIVALLAAEYEVDCAVLERDLRTLFFSLASSCEDQISTSFYTVDKGFNHLLDFPLRMEIEVTALCNWNCGFCYNVWKIDPSLSDREVKMAIREMPMKHLPKEVIFRVLDECAERGAFIVRYSGGETMLHPDIMEIFRYGADKRMFQVLFTNGHFLDAQVVQELDDSNVRTVLISVHGGPAQHNALTGRRDAYDKALRAIELCLNQGLEVVVEMTLLRENLPLVLSNLRSMYDLGVREFRVMRYVPTGKNDEDYAVPMSEMLPLMKQIDELQNTVCQGVRVGWPCGQKFCTSSEDSPLSQDDPTMRLRFNQLTGHCESGLVWGSISFDGNVRNCPHSNVYHGSVLSEKLEDSWKRMTSRVAEALAQRASCDGCSVFGVCKGGCHLPHFIETKPSQGGLISIGRMGG